MTDAITSGLLVIERQNAFKIDLRNPPTDWKDALQNHSRSQTLSFTHSSVEAAPRDRGEPTTDAVVVDVDKVMLQLAVALRSYPHHGITKIEFDNCPIAELGMLCISVMNPLPTTMSSKLSLFFRSTTMDLSMTKTLCNLLEDNLLDELSLEYCTIDGPTAKALEASLGKNTSLQYLNCSCRSDASKKKNFLLPCIRNTLLTNRTNLVKLRVGVPDKESFWSIFRAATKGTQTSMLQRLEVRGSRIPLQAAEALIMMCWTINSLQDLHFSGCTFTQAALDYLNETLSNREILDNLAFEYCETLQPDQDDYDEVDFSFHVNFGKVHVRQLSLLGTQFEPQAFAQMMEDIRNNPFIESLNVSGGVINSNEAFETFNEALLQQSRGPSELVIDADAEDADTLTEALQHNSNIKVLTIRETDVDSLPPFARGLANMRNLCKLTFIFVNDIVNDNDLPEEFLQALEQAMEHNTALQSLTIRGAGVTEELAKRYLPKIRYYLAINRIKRNSLMVEPDVPNGLWAHVLSKTSKETDGIYFVLMGMPDIVTTSDDNE